VRCVNVFLIRCTRTYATVPKPFSNLAGAIPDSGKRFGQARTEAGEAETGLRQLVRDDGVQSVWGASSAKPTKPTRCEYALQFELRLLGAATRIAIRASPQAVVGERTSEGGALAAALVIHWIPLGVSALVIRIKYERADDAGLDGLAIAKILARASGG